MKRFFLHIFLFVLVLAWVGSVSAQTPACPVYPSQAPNMLGLTCGVSTDPCARKCCVSNAPSQSNPRKLPIISDMLEILGIGNPFDPLNQLSSQAQSIAQPCMNGYPSTPGDLANPGCMCLTPTPNPLTSLYKTCENISSAGEKAKCLQCLKGTGAGGAPGVWTSIGCVYADVGNFIQQTLLGWGVGFAGGISTLCIMYAAFMMQSSRGNAEVIKKSQQLLTSCITGLMLIIFSVFILRLIGVTILKIPGFM